MILQVANLLGQKLPAIIHNLKRCERSVPLKKGMKQGFRLHLASKLPRAALNRHPGLPILFRHSSFQLGNPLITVTQVAAGLLRAPDDARVTEQLGGSVPSVLRPECMWQERSHCVER